MQYIETETRITVFASDATIWYVCELITPDFATDYPFDSLTPGYSREQNNSDYLEWHSSYRSTSNKILEQKSSEGALLTAIDTPLDSDKKMVVTISPATTGWKTWITGAGDDLNLGRGEGNAFVLNFETTGSMSSEFEFIEPVEVHDGQITWKPVSNWSSSDNFSVGIRIPANNAVLTGSNGNCVLVPTGLGYNVIVPYPDGPYFIDLNLAVPLSTPSDDGYWDVDYDSGSVTASITPGQAGYHLIDVEISAWMLRKIPMGSPMGTFDIDAYKTEYMHPSWKLVWQANKTSPEPGTISGWMFVFRKNVSLTYISLGN